MINKQLIDIIKLIFDLFCARITLDLPESKCVGSTFGRVPQDMGLKNVFSKYTLLSQNMKMEKGEES